MSALIEFRDVAFAYARPAERRARAFGAACVKDLLLGGQAANVNRGAGVRIVDIGIDRIIRHTVD